jgi:hypothetical protein
MTNFCPGANTRDTRCCILTLRRWWLSATHSTYAISSWAWRSRRWLGYWQPIWRMQFLRGRGGQGVGSVIGNPFDVCNFFVAWRSILYCMHTQQNKGVWRNEGNGLRQLDGVERISKLIWVWRWQGVFYHQGLRWKEIYDIKFEKESVMSAKNVREETYVNQIWQQQGHVSSGTKFSGYIRQSNLKRRVQIIIKDRGESSDNQVK